MAPRHETIDGSAAWRGTSGACTLASAFAALLLACTERDDTLLTSPVGPSTPGRIEAGAAGAAEPIAPGPVQPPSGPVRPRPKLPTKPAPVDREPALPEPSPPAPSITPPPGVGSDACSPVVAESSCARAALAPFEQRCGTGGLTRSGAHALGRFPYLQQLSDTSVNVLYKRRIGAGTSDAVEITLPDGSVVTRAPTITDPGSSGERQRIARIDGLSPGTYYCYTVGNLTERIGFRTAPPPDADASLRFAVLGDSGDASVGAAAVRDRLAALPIDLVLHTGDAAYLDGTLEQFEQNFFRVYEGLIKSVAIFPVAGNHEYHTDAAAPFLEVFDLPENGDVVGRERWYSFDFGDVHFVGLDTEQLGAEQTEWLERDLADNQRRWTVVYFHRPPFSSGTHGNAPDVEQAFVPVLQSHAVPIVFAGHDHSYERTLPIGGVTYVISGGGGRLTRPVGTSDFTVKSQAVLHVTHVEVRGRSMTVRAIDVAGTTIDSFELTLPD
jgi:3',5'-cyclic AMP phosphodiesterase CpdA